MLAVARTDLMRIVVYVPDRDVPYVKRGAEAILRVEALNGEEFHGKVARFSVSEDSLNRTMRTEVDLENPSGLLRQGMYGNVTIVLEPASPDTLAVPSSALIQAAQHGRGAVFVVRGGRAHRTSVRVGKDDGLRVEILSGVTPDDQVITSYSGSVEDGEPVTAVTAGAERSAPSKAGG